MNTRANLLYLSNKRRAGIFIAVGLLLMLGLTPVPTLIEQAHAAEQTCDVTTTFNVVSPGTTVTISWRTSGYTEATLNGESVSVGSGSKTFTVNANTAYKLEASNGRSGSKCTVSTTVYCRQSTPPLNPVDPKPPVDPRDPNPPLPPITPDPPMPQARAYLSVWTEGFLSPLTTGERTIAEDKNITALNWQSINATQCETRGFSTGNRLTGSITSGQDISLSPGQTKIFSIRCQNEASIWSDWETVKVIKQADSSLGRNRAPSAPIISGADELTAASINGVVSQNIPFTFKAVDPDGDRIMYRIDWDANGIIDTRLPGVGYVSSGSAATHTYFWSAPGLFTFRAQALDEYGEVSGWTTHTIRINETPDPDRRPAPPQVTLLLDRNLIRVGDATTARLRVLADYEVSCTVYGIAGGSDSFIHAGGVTEQEYMYQTDRLLAMQVVRAVCIPRISGVPMPTEVRERRVSVAASIEER